MDPQAGDNPSGNKAQPESLPAEAIEFASRMYNAAREGDVAIFEQALPAGLPPNLTNEKGDTLVRCVCPSAAVYVLSCGAG